MAAAPELAIRDSEFAGTFGVARSDITPPPGIYARCWGSSTHDIASGVHKPLLATCAVFADADGKNDLVLLALDLSWWSSKQDELDLRTNILKGSGLREQALMLHPSHTHSAPRTALEFVDRPGGHLIPQYRAQIKATCIDLIAKARQSLAPATLTWRAGRCELAFNRDLVSPTDGRVLCGLNPSVHADETLLVGRVVNGAGKLRASLVNYACHPISLGGGNTLVSPDYVGSMREIVEGAAEFTRGDDLHVLDHWTYLGTAQTEEELAVLAAKNADAAFDAGIYKILARYLAKNSKLDWLDLRGSGA